PVPCLRERREGEAPRPVAQVAEAAQTLRRVQQRLGLTERRLAAAHEGFVAEQPPTPRGDDGLEGNPQLLESALEGSLQSGACALSCVGAQFVQRGPLRRRQATELHRATDHVQEL